jgi:phage tail sheath protein FI
MTTMPEYLAPGVYVEELTAGVRPIEGVSTSTAGFVGETERGTTRPTLVTSWTEYERSFGGCLDRPPFNRTNAYLPYAVRGFFDNGGSRLYIARVVGHTAVAARVDLGTIVVQALGEGLWGNNVIVSVRAATAAHAATRTAAWFRLQVAYYRDGVPTRSTLVDPFDPTQLGNPRRIAPDVLEDFDNLTSRSDDQNYAPSVVNARSRLIQISTCIARPGDIPFPGVRLQNGSDVAATLTDYAGQGEADPTRRRGLGALSTIDEVSLLAAPDEMVIPGLRDHLIDVCEAMKNRFAVLAADRGVTSIATLRPPRDTAYAAFYFPWVRVPSAQAPGGHQLVPPVGHVAGIYARVDVERGVHKAPANEVVRGILTRDVDGHTPLEFTVSTHDGDILNQRGVNVIRDFRSAGRGIRVWGARTMASDATWRYINVRRLFIFVEQSIDRGTQWVVFEPNSEPTWKAIRRTITNFLATVWRTGALMGTREDEAFFVKCDRTTMTQDDIDNGRLIVLVGIAPLKPAEFVIFRIAHQTGDGA